MLSMLYYIVVDTVVYTVLSIYWVIDYLCIIYYDQNTCGNYVFGVGQKDERCNVVHKMLIKQ